MTNLRHRFATILATVALVACGGTTSERRETPPTTPALPVAETPPAETATASEEAPPSPPETPPTAAVEPPPAPPPPEPVTATTADELRETLFAASTDMSVFRRFIEPDFGVGVLDPRDAGVAHYCDMDRLSSSPGLGFLMGVDDRFSCDRNLHRCVLQGSDGGYVFYFRRGEGDTIWLDTIAHYEHRAPTSDSAVARAFTHAGEGVCALYRTLTDADTSPPAAFSVFVSSETGLVPDALSQHLCGDEAAAAYAERVPSAAARPPDRCDRDPARCTYSSTDEEVTVYGDEGTPTAVTVMRPGMRQDLARAQDHDRDAFLHGVRRRECPAE